MHTKIIRGIASRKVFRDKGFAIISIPKCDGYQMIKSKDTSTHTGTGIISEDLVYKLHSIIKIINK